MSRNHGESWMQRFIDRFPRCLQQETLGTPPTTPGSPQGKEGIDKPLRPDTTCIDDKDVYSLTKKINLCTNAKKLNQKRGGTAAAAHGGRRSSTRNTSERSHVLAHMLSMLCEREAGVGRSGSGIYTPHWVEEEDVTGSEAGGDGEEKREIRGGGVVPLRSPNTGGGWWWTGGAPRWGEKTRNLSGAVPVRRQRKTDQHGWALGFAHLFLGEIVSSMGRGRAGGPSIR